MREARQGDDRGVRQTSGRKKRASSCSNHFGHANACCSSLFTL